MKNNLAKLITLFTVLVTGVLTGASLTFAAGAHEYENPPCYDVTGSTTAVLVSGVNNGGVMNFDDPGVNAAAQACVRMSSSAPGAVPVRLEGWVWNTNLGWVSLYCPGGGGALNLGYACGSVAYSVNFNATGGTAPDFANVTMNGYAWGDNIGWISFDSAYHELRPTSSGVNRGYVDPSFPAVIRHAWADSVGWLDFAGVRFYWFDSDPPIPGAALNYVNICSQADLLPGPYAVGAPKCSCDLDSTCTQLTDKALIPYATGGSAGADAYNLDVGFVDAGVKIDNLKLRDCASDSVSMYTTGSGGYTYCGRIALTWEDDVDYDQTTAASQTQSSPKFNSNNSGATRKPLSGMGGDFSYIAFDTEWRANLASFAPTSDANASADMQNEKFYYSDGLGGYDGTKTSQNLLRLKEIKLLMFKYSTDGVTPGTCIYGTINGSNCDLRNYMAASGSTLSFKPVYDFGTLNYVDLIGGKVLKFINVGSPDAEVRFEWMASWLKGVLLSGTLDVHGYVGLQDGGAYRMKFVPVYPSDEASAYTDAAGPSAWDTIYNLSAQLYADTPGAAVSATAGPYLYTKVSYQLAALPGQTIRYFSNKLPRIKAGLLINPVAKVQGNVFITDFAQKAADVSLRSLGNIASNLKREQILRNVSKFLRGTSITGSGDATPTSSRVVINNLSAPAASGLNELLPGKVYYVKGSNLEINCGADCNLADGTKKTFIVENGNIFVRSNVIASNGSQVGLIALRNLEGDRQDQGFLYLEKDVTWLSNVNIYLDRVMQSYNATGGNFYDANGFYVGDTADDYGRQGLYTNQLVIEGTIASMNGVGNASRNPASDESGATIGGSNICTTYRPAGALANICRARVVDLNYLRYYGPGLEICTGSEGTGAVVNAPRDQALKAGGVDPALGCNPEATGYDIDATALYDGSTPNGDLVAGGGSGTKSKYYTSKGVAASLANEYPVNFFYKPIANDLPGFEVELSINPSIE
ncbi:hypothetical protein IT411_00090 [Candidatus Peregrinibacteria bacterium]|nr:hypothetical protein [Candidatus Peregrinibacteria bacterium]